MRRLLVFALVLVLAGVASADDALVLPKGVLRLYLVPAYGFMKDQFDEDGDRADMEYETMLFNLGFAVEYGLTDQISLGAQWVLGYTIWSTLDPEPAPLGTATLNGPSDLFLGAKIQVIGTAAYVASERTRLTLAPGLLVPLPGPSAEEQRRRLMDDESWVAGELAKHAWGIGARAYFDYVFAESVFVDLYAEFIYYLEKEYNDSVNYLDSRVEHGYSLTLQAEPQYETVLAMGIKGSAGLVANLNITPETVVDDVGQDNEGYLFSLRPNLGLFLMNTPVPLEFKATYNLPLLGKNRPALNMFALECRVYLKF